MVIGNGIGIGRIRGIGKGWEWKKEMGGVEGGIGNGGCKGKIRGIVEWVGVGGV